MIEIITLTIAFLMLAGLSIGGLIWSRETGCCRKWPIRCFSFLAAVCAVLILHFYTQLP